MTFSPDQAWRVLQSAERLCSAAVISETIARMAREISAVLAASCPLVLCVMRGGVIFAGHLLPQLRFPLELDYLDLTRYGAATQGGEISWRVAPGAAVADRTVLVVDDILDEGYTLAAIRSELLAARASRVCIAALVDKDTGRPKTVTADFIGVRVPNRYVFGFGMDVQGMWRNLPDIYALKE